MTNPDAIKPVAWEDEFGELSREKPYINPSPLYSSEQMEAAVARGDALEAMLAEAAKVLEPFAKASEIKLCGDWKDEERFAQTDVGFHLNFGHLRASRALLLKLQDHPHE